MKRASHEPLLNTLRRALGADARAEATDGELLEQFALHQDDVAFTALLRRHGPMVWSVCQRLVAHRQDAEDCFQATFLVLCQKAGSIGRSKLLANWLYGVAWRTALNARARRARRARHEALCATPPDVPGAAARLCDESPSVLDEELARLPDKYRAPLLLCSLEGMTHAQAGKSLGWPVGTVAGRLSRARELLRSRLLRRGILAPGAVLAAWHGAETASAGVPPQLAAASVRSAVALSLAGQAAPADIPTTVTALAHGVLRQMLFHRLLTKSILAAVLAVLLGGAIGTWHRLASAQSPPVAPAGPVLAAEPPVPARKINPPPIPARPALRLPADPDAVVLRMERCVDGFKGLGTRVTVFADGRVVTEVPEGLSSLSAQKLTQFVRGQVPADKEHPVPKMKVLQGKLSAAELAELVRVVAQEQEFLTFDPKAVKVEIRDKYQSDAAVRDDTDATTVDFQIQLADRTHQVRWSRLGRSMWNFPDVQRLRQLCSVEFRLAHLYYVLLAGGPECVEAVVAKMDRLVEPYYVSNPKVPRLTAADLYNVTAASDGSFVRYDFLRPKAKFDIKPLFAVSIDVPQQGNPSINCLIPPQ
jgi:RNA polymerase sigma factor (sigma-70 family)